MNQFAQSLEASLQLAHRLEAVLLEETSAIESRDPDHLQRIVADKKNLVTQLEEETDRQRQWVELAKQPFTTAGMTKFLASLDQDDQLLGRWSRLREAITRCDRMNQVNARLIERNRKRVAMSLRILGGDDGSPPTYNPRGYTERTSPRSRTISQA